MICRYKGDYVAAVAESAKTSEPQDSPGISSAEDLFATELVAKDKAFEELNKALENREYTVRFLKIDPSVDVLRDDPRFKELMRRMKLPE